MMSNRFEAHNVELIKEAWGAYEYDEGAGWEWVSRLADALEEAVERIAELEAERDAAVAAIERVREEHQPCYTCAEPHCFRCKEAQWPCATFQALDGAPEPEWEWAVRALGDDEPFSDIYPSREHLAEHETGIAWGDEQLVRRRKAGPWLPVEGERK